MKKHVVARIVIGIAPALLPAIYGCGSDTPAVAADPGPVPGAPTGFMAMEMGTGAHMTWNDTYSNETGFELQRKDGTADFAGLMDLPANTTDYHDATITPGVDYVYRVRALSAAGPGAWSAEASFHLEATVPGKPTKAGSMLMGGGVHFYWRDNTSNETGFEIQRHEEQGDFATVHTTAANETAWMDMNAPHGHKHTYRVRAVTPTGDTDWSSEVTISL